MARIDRYSRIRRFALFISLTVLYFIAGPWRAWAGDLAPYAALANNTFNDTASAVEMLGQNGDPRALPVIEALSQGRLLVDPASGTIYIRDKTGALTTAADGASVAAAPEGLTPLRLNNRVRRAIEAAMGGLTLRVGDPAKRLEAAQAVFHQHEADALPAVETALAQEKDPRVALRLREARAAILLFKPDTDPAAQLAAIDILRARGDQDALGVLTGLDAGSEPLVKEAADSAARSIRNRIALWSHLQDVWFGLSLGSVLLLAAIGLAITFGVMGVINMAHGEMVMIGAYTTYAVQEVIRQHNPAWFDSSLFIALPLAFLVTGMLGIAIERLIIRHLYGRPLETLLATFGLALILQQAVRTIFGPNNREVGAPAFMAGTFDLGGLSITYGRMWIILFALAVFAALQMLLRASPFGLKMRAVTQNRQMAASMGISTDRIDALAFGLGSGIAGIAGVALSQIDNVSPNLGQSYIIDSFMVVVFGGVGNLWGTLVAAMTLGVANKLLEPFAGAVLAKIALLVFIILFIQKRPRGLFALKGRSVEA